MRNGIDKKYLHEITEFSLMLLLEEMKKKV